MSDSVIVLVNGYADKIIDYNSTFYYYIFSLDVADNGSIRANLISQESFDVWSKGQYQPSWYEFNYPYTDGPRLSNALASDGSQTQYLIFSNPDAFSKEVTFQIYKEWIEYEDDSFSLATGISLIVIGAVAVVVMVALFLAKQRSQLKDFHKALEN